MERISVDKREPLGGHGAASGQRSAGGNGYSMNDRQLRGPEQPGQLQHLRRPRQPARPGRRRRPEPLRRDGQPRVRASTTRPGRCSSGRSTPARSGRASPVPDCTDPRATRSSLYDQLADRWILTQFTTTAWTPDAPFYNCVAISRPATHRRLLPLRLHDRASTSRTTRSTASGRTRTSSRPASSGRRSSTASASTPSRRTR